MPVPGPTTTPLPTGCTPMTISITTRKEPPISSACFMMTMLRHRAGSGHRPHSDEHAEGRIVPGSAHPSRSAVVAASASMPVTRPHPAPPTWPTAPPLAPDHATARPVSGKGVAPTPSGGTPAAPGTIMAASSAGVDVPAPAASITAARTGTAISPRSAGCNRI
jgi:hypothetical protein